MAYKKPEEISLGPWPDGMNNRQPDYALPPNTLRNAVNADIDRAGRARRRQGYTKVFSGVSTRGGYSCPAGAFFVQGSKLMRLNADNTAATLYDGVVGEYAAYEYFNGTVYFSDGVVNKKIVSGVVSDWGRLPLPAPSVAAIPGALPPGTYMVAAAEIDSAGIEHGTSEAVTIRTNVESGLHVSGFPSGKTVRVYVSSTNGTTLFAAAQTTAGSCYVATTAYVSGRPATTQFMSGPPPGRIIKEYNGRMYVAAGNTVWYTEPYSPELVSAASGFLQFHADVTVMEPGEAGMWIVSDKTEFYAGASPLEFRPRTVLDYGAVYGTSHVLPQTKDVLWYSTRGVVMGTKDGQATNLQEANVAADTGTAGAALIREQDGTRHVVVSVRDASVSPLASTSFLEMEVIRKAAQ